MTQRQRPDDNVVPLGRTLPHNIEAEKALLGACLVNVEAFKQAADIAEPQHFALAGHGILFQAMGVMVKRGQLCDTVTMRHYAEAHPDLQDLGGERYLVDLLDSAVTVSNAEAYARTLVDLHQRRLLIYAGDEVIGRATRADLDDNSEIQIGDALSTFNRLDGEIQAETAPDPAQEVHAVMAALEEDRLADGRSPGLPTNLLALDEIIGGLKPGNVITLAGASSMGKSAMAVTLADNCASTEEVVGLFSLEMTTQEVHQRRLAARVGMTYDQVDGAKFSDEDAAAIAEAGVHLQAYPVSVDDTPRLRVNDIHRRARRLRRHTGLSLVIVDHLQLIEPESRRAPRVDQLEQITGDIKAMAKELAVPVILCSQLARMKGRDDKRPGLDDLRSSGSIEQDSDLVIFLYRHIYSLLRSEPIRKERELLAKFEQRLVDWHAEVAQYRGKAQAIVGKHRNGKTGVADLHFNETAMRFEDE